MILIVKYFGVIADLTHKKEEQFYVEQGMNSLDQIRLKLEKQYPEIKQVAYAIALNQTVMQQDALVNENDELALLPPFAGG